MSGSTCTSSDFVDIRNKAFLLSGSTVKNKITLHNYVHCGTWVIRIV